MKDDPVRAALAARGCPAEVVAAGWRGLVARWREVVKSIWAGDALTEDDYLNDMDLREIIEGVMPLVRVAERRRIVRLDEVAKRHLERAERCLWGERAARENGWTAERNWWYFMRPRGGFG